MIRILLADDQELVRTGFRMIIETEPDLEVVGEAADGMGALNAIAELRPDVVLMDVRMPRLDGLEATKRLASVPDAPKVIILTTFDLDDYVYEAMRAGASGFLLKDAPREQLTAGIRMVHSGDALMAPTITRRLIERFTQLPPPSGTPAATDSLTEREREVLILAGRGLSNTEIGQKLFIGEATVKTHLSRAMQKLDLRDRVQAVVFAYETGLITPGAE